MYCGYIVELKNLRKHTNADRLQCVEVFGNNVIVDLSYTEGQKCVFFPVDGKLSEKYAEDNNLVRKKDENDNNVGGYLEPDKRNIRALKLRGERSEGLVLPIETLSPYTDISKLKIGDKITSLNGQLICEKYIPQKRNRNNYNGANGKGKDSKNKELKESFPLFKEHVDTEQLAYNQAAFKLGDKCIITLKVHGTSARTSYSQKITTKKRRWYHKLLRKKPPTVKSWDFISGTRRTVLSKFDDNSGYYGTNTFRKPYHDFFKGKLEKGEEIYYEIVGWIDENTSIMGIGDNTKFKDKDIRKLYGDKMIFSYGCKPGENKIFVYRMTLTNEDGFVVEYPDWLMRLRCEQMGVECVPKFDEFTFTTWEDLMGRVEKYYDGPDPIGKTHIREGVVVRIENREKFKAYKHKNFVFKLVEGIIKEEADTPDIEEAEELIQSETGDIDGAGTA